jgi:hypothetical protein
MNKQEHLINYAANAGVLNSAGKLPYQKLVSFLEELLSYIYSGPILVSEKTIFTPALQFCMLDKSSFLILRN